MGGNAFAEDNFNTPRMPAEVYYPVRDKLHQVLESHFDLVATPIEAPGKTDFGDIDILVEGRKYDVDSDEVTMEDVYILAHIIGAKATKKQAGSSTINLAVLWTDDLDTIFPESSGPHPRRWMMPAATMNVGQQESVVDLVGDGLTKIQISPTAGDRETKYIQIDVCICPSPHSWSWHLFFHNHGDFWNILGSVIRRFGLTCTNHGLYIRIAELESYNKNLSRLKMTADPGEVLKYLGLDGKRWDRRFASLDEMMDYAATCRFHDPGWGREYDGDKAKDQLKANDRQRVGKRPVFAHWIEVYLPAHRDDVPTSAACKMSREEVIEDAKEFFGHPFARIFDECKEHGLRKMRMEKLWANVKRSLKSMPVEGVEIGYVMKGLKREIVEEGIERQQQSMKQVDETEDSSGRELSVDTVDDALDGDERTRSAEGIDDTEESEESVRGHEELSDVQKAFAEGHFDEVEQWCLRSWKEVGERQKAVDQGKRQSLDAKTTRR